MKTNAKKETLSRKELSEITGGTELLKVRHDSAMATINNIRIMDEGGDDTSDTTLSTITNASHESRMVAIRQLK